ncbi:MAG: HEPN domain-containing protein [Candidatus Bipolaricaulota bacterium]|nr:HEPN domain-containing protein [Candidatus Bipolaricaulota bacterium]
MERSRDWWTQAQADLAHAKAAASVGHFDWACFAAHQAAEKGLKAAFERRGEKVGGHSVRYLLSALGEGVPPELLSAAKVLDKHYIPTRYPNGLAQGAPTEFYTREEAEDAIRRAEEILRFCDRLLAG